MIHRASARSRFSDGNGSAPDNEEAVGRFWIFHGEEVLRKKENTVLLEEEHNKMAPRRAGPSSDP